MGNDPIVRDFAFIKSSVPFPADDDRAGAPSRYHRQRTGSNSSSSSSSGMGSSKPGLRNAPASVRTQKPLSPVAEEPDGNHSRRRLTSTSPDPRVRSRVANPSSAHRPGRNSLPAELFTAIILSIPPRETKDTESQRSTSRAKSHFQRIRLSIRARLPRLRKRS